MMGTQVHPIPQGFGSEAPLIAEEAPDITDEAAYSIQEDKLKTEDDNRYSVTVRNRSAEPNEWHQHQQQASGNSCPIGKTSTASFVKYRHCCCCFARRFDGNVPTHI